MILPSENCEVISYHDQGPKGGECCAGSLGNRCSTSVLLSCMSSSCEVSQSPVLLSVTTVVKRKTPTVYSAVLGKG